MADKEDNDLDHTNPTDQIIAQGRALVRAIEAMDVITPTGRFERWQTRLLQTAYRYRLRGPIKTAPTCVAGQIPSASEYIGVVDDETILPSGWAQSALPDYCL
jgi:hypothetical protein